MKKERVERLFAWLIHQVDNKYHEEVNMAMDCFLEETYTQEELGALFGVCAGSSERGRL